ncbi:MAG: DUF502 domain-containing protein [Desulfobulbaceae bacterium]|nr:MAG: DUF502 domain-containing protein [Desulfobulbaceae bacterium]
MRYITNIFLKGLGATLPIILTFYLLYWLGSSIEQLLKPIMLSLLPEGIYLPGIGLLSGVTAIFCIGLLVEAWLIKHLFSFSQKLMTKIPVVKSIYNALRDFVEYFTRPSEGDDGKKVVIVRIGEARLIGFITAETMGLIKTDPGEELVTVYLPMSYQIGGYTLHIPERMIEPLDMSVEDAMRLVLTAGMSK